MISPHPNIWFYLVSFLVLIFFVCFEILVFRATLSWCYFSFSFSYSSLLKRFCGGLSSAPRTQGPTPDVLWCSGFLFHHGIGKTVKSDMLTTLGREGQVCPCVCLGTQTPIGCGSGQQMAASFCSLSSQDGDKGRREEGDLPPHPTSPQSWALVSPLSWPHMALRMAVLWLLSHISLLFLVHKEDFFFSPSFVHWVVESVGTSKDEVCHFDKKSTLFYYLIK